MNETMGTLRYASDNGYEWSSTAHASLITSYVFNLDSISTYPSYSLSRWYGFMVRCTTKKMTEVCAGP